MGRKLTMLATIMVLPGGLAILIAIALTVGLMRTRYGRRLLIPLERRIPPRLRAHTKRILGLVSGEKLFLPAPTRVQST